MMMMVLMLVMMVMMMMMMVMLLMINVDEKMQQNMLDKNMESSCLEEDMLRAKPIQVPVQTSTNQTPHKLPKVGGTLVIKYITSIILHAL